MEIVILDTEDLWRLPPILEEWQELSPAESHGVQLEMSHGMNTFRHLVTSPNSDVIAAIVGGDIVGLMGIYMQPYHLGPQIFAHECCFFVSPQHRGRAGLALIRGAEEWARKHQASHFIITASRLAGDGDRSSELYDRLGFSPMETDFLKAL